MEGPRYSTDFRSGGWVYTRTTRDGETARLQYRLDRVAFGPSALFDASAFPASVPVQVSPTSVVYTHGELVREVYSARHDGIAQSFALGALQPGDLRITGTIETTLLPERVPGGPIQFFAPAASSANSLRVPHFTYGEPTIIDATGKRVRGRVALEGDSLAIIFREEQLNGLVAPLLVDPVIGWEILVSYGGPANNVSVAWNYYLQEWLVVFDDGGSIWAQRINKEGELVGYLFQIGAGSKPHVVGGGDGYGTSEYVVAYETSTGGVGLSFVWASNAFAESSIIDDNSDGRDLIALDPQVEYYVTTGALLVAWSDGTSGGQQSLVGKLLWAPSPPYVSDPGVTHVIEQRSATSRFRRPRMGLTGFSEFIAWEDPAGGIQAGYYLPDWYSISQSGSDLLISPTGQHPVVSYSPEGWLDVVWSDRLIGADFDIYAQRIEGPGPVGGIRTVFASWADQTHPAIASSYHSSLGYVDDEFLVPFLDSNGSVLAQPLDAQGVPVGASLALGIQYSAPDGGLAVAFGFEQPTDGSSASLVVWGDYYGAVGLRVTETLPRVIASDPAPHANNIPTDYSVKVYFSKPVLASTIDTSSCKLVDAVTLSPVSSAVTYSSTERSVLIDPSSNLIANRAYRISIATSVKDLHGNGMETPYEALFGTLAGPGFLDTDGDGLLDVEEQLLGTDPSLADTDGDGRSDLVELNVSDPLRKDTDGDGVEDGPEIIAGTNPRDPKSGGVPGFDVTPPKVVAVSPPHLSEQVETTVHIFVTFDEPIDPATVVLGTNFKVEKTSVVPAQPVAGGSPELENGNRVIHFTPDSLSEFSDFRVTVLNGAGGVKDVAGNLLGAPSVTTFRTRGTSAPAIASQEALQHPSFGEPTSAGATNRSFGDGNGAGQGNPGTGGGAEPEDEVECTPDLGAPVMVDGGGENCECAEDTTYGIFRKGGTENCDPSSSGVPDFDPDSPGMSVVSLVNGAFIHERVDWAHPDSSECMTTFRRTYRSNLVDPTAFGEPYVGLYGYKTVSNWETRIIGFNAAGGNFWILTPKGRFYQATWTGSGWTLPAGFFARVHFDPTGGQSGAAPARESWFSPFSVAHADEGNGLLKLIFRNGLSYAYRESDGRLSYMRDRNGRKKQLSYMDGKLNSVTDAAGRSVTFNYDGDGLLESLSIFDGLSVGYEYDSMRLTQAASPFTAEFPTGRKDSYEYSNFDFMTSLSNGRGEKYLENNFDPFTGVVLAQHHIDGTHHYGYDFTPAQGVKTTLIDRTGYTTQVQHDLKGSPVSLVRFGRGENPLDPTPSWTTTFSHNAAGLISEVILPRGDIHTWQYTSMGQVTEHRRKQDAQPPNDATDLVGRWKIDPHFGRVLRHMPSRANDPGLTPAERVAHTRFYFYDHEDMDARLEVESDEMGAPVAIAGSAFKTYGRTGAGQFPAQTPGVFADSDLDLLPDRGGNLWIALGPAPRVVDPANPSQFQAQRQVIEEFSTYNLAGQVILEKDASGDVTRFQYYSGAFHPQNNSSAGYLRRVVVDSGLTPSDLDLATGNPLASEPQGKLALTTSYGYDSRGNVLWERSPRGASRPNPDDPSDHLFLTRYTYDESNLLLTRTVSAPFNYVTSYRYDGNMKLIEERIPNVLPSDSNGNGIQDGAGEQSVGSPTYFRNTYAYCVCNSVVSETVDADGLALTTTYEYDLSQRKTLVRDPEGDTEVTVYDERDRPIRVTRGANDTAVASTTRYVYDANGKVLRIHDDDLDVDPADTPTTYTYDAFGRATVVADEMGNTSETTYVPFSELVARTVQRGPDAASGSPEILAQTFFVFDEADRNLQVDRDHFDAVAEAAIGVDGLLNPPVTAHAGLKRGHLSSAVSVLDADGRPLWQIDDNLGKTQFAYDPAGRLALSIDRMGNRVTSHYDDEGNGTGVLEEAVDDLGGQQSYVSRAYFDELGRTRLSHTPLGNATRYVYDSRGNVIERADAQADNLGNSSALDTYGEHTFAGAWPDVAVSGRGNRTRFTHDAAGRLTQTDLFLTADGSGNSAVVDTITLGRRFDRASQLVGQTDDNGNETKYVLDALGRNSAMVNADGTQKRYFYDRASNFRIARDERSVVMTNSVDRLGRLTQVSVSNLPPGPEQTTYEVYQYDGLSRLVYGENNHSKLRLRYDSFGPVIREEQTINVGPQRWAQADPWPQVVEGTVSSAFNGLSSRTQLNYPGGTVVSETYDLAGRRKLIKHGSTTLTEYMYAGRGSRVLEKRLPQASVTLFRAYDADRRVTRHDQRRTTDGVRVAGFAYAWDRTGNRWYERTLLPNANPSETAGDGEAFSYDSAYRLRANYEAVPSASLDLLQSNAPRHSSAFPYATKREYALNGVGNRSHTLTNGVVDTVYQSLGTDEQVNQYTTVGGVTQQYDLAGCLVGSASATFSFSYRSQRLSANVGGGPAVYRFDVLGRRVSKRMVTGNFPSLAYGHAVYINSGARLLSEHDSGGVARKLWIYGNGIDEVIRQTAPDLADLDNDSHTTELVDAYYLCNSLGTVVALVDTNGVAKERYAYDVWGAIRDVIDKNGASTVPAWTRIGNPWCFVGRQMDFEERVPVYQIRARDYAPALGHLLQRDPGGAWYDPAGRGNPRTWAGGNPINAIDPTGLATLDVKVEERARGTSGGFTLFEDPRHVTDPSAIEELRKNDKQFGGNGHYRDCKNCKLTMSTRYKFVLIFDKKGSGTHTHEKLHVDDMTKGWNSVIKPQYEHNEKRSYKTQDECLKVGEELVKWGTEIAAKQWLASAGPGGDSHQGPATVEEEDWGPPEGSPYRPVKPFDVSVK